MHYDMREGLVDLNSLIKSVLKMCGVLADSKKIKFNVDLSPYQSILLGDERAIKPMLLNLISNGFKFTAEKGRVHVHVLWSDSGSILIKVRDTGIGIAENEIENVTGSFVQASARRYGKAAGTGLGRAIVKTFAKLHDAQFALSSKIGVGTEASICFPASRFRKYCPAA
ncbi:MAG: HAMP domain-containing sensor histidine kinase [Sneathiella sp.]